MRRDYTARSRRCIREPPLAGGRRDAGGDAGAPSDLHTLSDCRICRGAGVRVWCATLSPRW